MSNTKAINRWLSTTLTAAHFGVSASTVMRWHREKGFPDRSDPRSRRDNRVLHPACGSLAADPPARTTPTIQVGASPGRHRCAGRLTCAASASSSWCDPTGAAHATRAPRVHWAGERARSGARMSFPVAPVAAGGRFATPQLGRVLRRCAWASQGRLRNYACFADCLRKPQMRRRRAVSWCPAFPSMAGFSSGARSELVIRYREYTPRVRQAVSARHALKQRRRLSEPPRQSTARTPHHGESIQQNLVSLDASTTEGWRDETAAGFMV